MNLDRYLIFGNDIVQWATACGIALASILALHLLLRLTRGRFAAFARHTATTWDDLILHTLGRTRWFFLIGTGCYAGSIALELPHGADLVLFSITVGIVLIQIGMWSSGALVFWAHDYRERSLKEDRAATTTLGALVFLGQLVIWSAVALLVLQNAGVDITALITGLGIGGIAVALALQKVLGDLFSSLAIVFDKPFVLGDFVIVGELMGSVEKVGLKTTRIRSLSGEQLVFSNSDLLDSRIRNYGRMYERRVLFSLGVTYSTERSLLREIPGIVRAAVEAQGKQTRFDRSHFSGYGDFALGFESVYYVLSPDYNRYMDIQQAIYLRIHEEFERRGIEFAYPTQTLYLARSPVGQESAAA